MDGRPTTILLDTTTVLVRPFQESTNFNTKFNYIVRHSDGITQLSRYYIELCNFFFLNIIILSPTILEMVDGSTLTSSCGCHLVTLLQFKMGNSHCIKAVPFSTQSLVFVFLCIAFNILIIIRLIQI